MCKCLVITYTELGKRHCSLFACHYMISVTTISFTQFAHARFVWFVVVVSIADAVVEAMHSESCHQVSQGVSGFCPFVVHHCVC